MSFTAQDFLRKRQRSSSLSFFLNVLILLFLLISGITGMLQAEEKALLKFTVLVAYLPVFHLQNLLHFKLYVLHCSGLLEETET